MTICYSHQPSSEAINLICSSHKIHGRFLHAMIKQVLRVISMQDLKKIKEEKGLFKESDKKKG